MENIQINALYNLDKTIAKGIFKDLEYPWQALPKIKEFILELGNTLSLEEYYHPKENVWISKSATISTSAYINGPCIIDHNAEIRHCAFIRGNAIIGKNCVIGNSTELKNVILFDNVQVPHYNYVGDSILGFKAHMGAGAITSNVKSDKTLVTIKNFNTKIETGIKKVGAFIGDNVEIGCNSVLCPGCIIGKGTNIYPLSRVRGVIPPNCIFKSENNIIEKRNQEV